MMAVKLPVLPLRGLTLFPKATMPVHIGRVRSLSALSAIGDGGEVVAVMQLDPNTDEPTFSDLHHIGTTAKVVAVKELETSDHSKLVFLEGRERVRLTEELDLEPYLVARTEPILDIMPLERDLEFAALERNVRDLVHEVIQDAPDMPDEVLPILDKIEDPSVLTNLLAATLPSLKAPERQDLLGILDVRRRLDFLGEHLAGVRQEQKVRNKIRAEVSDRIDAHKREAVLREELDAIHRELGDTDETERELAELKSWIEKNDLPEEARKEADRELRRLRNIPTASPEHSLARGYLEWLAALPWNESSATRVDVKRAERVLDRDHHNLEQVKERILEHLAVLQLRQAPRGPILCFLGPPGVGKTSLGRSIAEATGRRFTRISLGGAGDEAEIRGHRRTYIGAMPGQIIQNIRRVGTNDPVFMIDEVDKLGRDFRGDPASALLEVLDPEQNNSFRDRYLDVPFDLSRVLFITTANLLEPIPPPLRDRMELIEIPGYVDQEKRIIARDFLIPRQVAETGLQRARDIEFTDDGIAEIISAHTREAGVRLLEQKIASICRKRAREVVTGGQDLLTVNREVASKLLGPARFRVEEEIEARTRIPGVAPALAWTEAGGEVLFVEATRMERDKGDFIVTGHVRKVMQESARAALSWLRANGERYGIPARAFREADIHVHVPTGAAPKDGPSAGVVMVIAMMSLFLGLPVRPRVAFTGEITLSGQVLPVGGIKGKVQAAKRTGIREVVIPRENEPNVAEELKPHLRDGLTIHFVTTIDEAIRRAFPEIPRSNVDWLPSEQWYAS